MPALELELLVSERLIQASTNPVLPATLEHLVPAAT